MLKIHAFGKPNLNSKSSRGWICWRGTKDDKQMVLVVTTKCFTLSGGEFQRVGAATEKIRF